MKTLNNVEALLRETDPSQIAELFAEADTVRRENIGDAVHFRALIELSNRCTRSCGYCGLRVENNALTRYEMTDEEILDSLQKALALDYHTVVLQAGECPSLSCERITNLVRKIKELAPIAVTLSLGEQPQATYEAWREAGADRYLLRFETSNPQLYSAIHPHAANAEEHPRIAPLRQLQELGYEVGSGMLVGIPSQTYRDLAADILLLQELQLDMIGLGPFLVHPATPLATPESCGLQNAGAEQVPASLVLHVSAPWVRTL